MLLLLFLFLLFLLLFFVVFVFVVVVFVVVVFGIGNWTEIEKVKRKKKKFRRAMGNWTGNKEGAVASNYKLPLQ